MGRKGGSFSETFIKDIGTKPKEGGVKVWMGGWLG